MGTQYSHLSITERAQIEVFAKHGCTLASIGRVIDRHRSTVMRELRRGRTLFAQYLALFGQRYYSSARKRVGLGRRKFGSDLRSPAWLCLKQSLELGWSPEQLCLRLRTGSLPAGPLSDFPLAVSHETIYRAIYGLPPSLHRQALVKQLRQSRAGRRKTHRGTQRFCGLQDFRPISQRPAAINARRQPGHWEGDLLKGASGSSTVVITLVERVSRLVRLVKLPNATAATMLKGLKARLGSEPPCMRRSLTYDRGTEMALHKDVEESLNIKVYFCNAYSPWQRGTNENTNGLLRQYLPKGTDLATVSNAKLARIEWLLNNRPRKILASRTPQEAYDDRMRRMRHHKLRAPAR